VIQAFDAAEASGTAAIQLEGKFIDYPVVERSRRILKISKLMS
jgi:citrate lyase subunit beta/citryl-CoA lyase